MSPAPTPPFKRLLASYEENASNGCWEWTGHTYKNGYGVIKVFGSDVSAHRYSYELHKGPIPDGLCILHACDNKRCINPDHLSIGTHQENMRQAADRSRMRSGAQHHLFGKRNPRPKQSNKVMVLGKVYESQKSAERALGLGSGTVRYWIKHKPNKAVVIGGNHA
jgi:hypothetical protein